MNSARPVSPEFIVSLTFYFSRRDAFGITYYFLLFTFFMSTFILITRHRYLNILWWNLMILSYLLFSYNIFNGWWYSGIGTVMVVFFAYLLWRNDFLYRIGLKMNYPILVTTLLLMIILTGAGFGLLKYLATRNGVVIQYSGYRNYIHDLFYTLNEEIILGAVLLNWVRERFRKMHPSAVSVIVAILFAFFHYLFYRWIFLDRGILTLFTLTTLTMVGILRNNLILTTGHVGFSWALHASWMAIMFGTYHYQAGNLEALHEFERFNLYLGSPFTFGIITALAFLSFFLFWSKQKPAKLIIKP